MLYVLSLLRRWKSALALWGFLQPGRRVTCCHITSPEVSGISKKKLGKWKEAQLGSLLRACREEKSVPQSFGTRQQYINLGCPANSVPCGQEKGSQGPWHHPSGQHAGRPGLSCFPVSSEEISQRAAID